MSAGLLLALVACGARAPSPAPSSGEGAEARVIVTAPPAETAPAAETAPPTAASLYAAGRARVEGEQSPGECAADTDCARAGCSQEVCVPATRVGAVITTCEILPVFAVLDACGCHEGACTWTLKEPALRRFPVPAGTPG
jgi:eight-cysteine-cluster-containing protein